MPDNADHVETRQAILVVDDDPDIREVLRDSLEHDEKTKGSATVLTVKTESGHLMRYPHKYFSHIGLRINDRLPGLVRARPLRGPSQASARVRPCAATGSAV